MKPIRTCVFPCAGFGTRFLPATKVIPKEMLPLIDKPVIQYGVEEALQSGLDRMIVITSRGKESILDHFDRATELEQFLDTKGKNDLLDEARELGAMADIIAVRQKEARGLGHAVLSARGAIGDEPFAVILPDDIILAEPPCLRQMLDVYEETGRPVVALMEVSAEETTRYGIAAGDRVGERRFRIRDMIEKPKSNPPSHYAIIGRYLLPPEIFPHLERTAPGAGGEIQITDALQKLIVEGDFFGYVFDGRRYDAGEKSGYLKATVDYALRHPTLGEAFRKYLEEILAQSAVR